MNTNLLQYPYINSIRDLNVPHAWLAQTLGVNNAKIA